MCGGLQAQARRWLTSEVGSARRDPGGRDQEQTGDGQRASEAGDQRLGVRSMQTVCHEHLMSGAGRDRAEDCKPERGAECRGGVLRNAFAPGSRGALC